MFGIAISGALGNSHAASDTGRNSLEWDYWNMLFCLFWDKKNLIHWSQHMKTIDRRENSEVDIKIISTAEREQPD